MQLKSYTAPTMADAMALVRQELGEDAIIVSIQRAAGNQGVRITAALDHESDDAGDVGEDNTTLSPSLEILQKSFLQHGVPEALTTRLLMAARLVERQEPLAACAMALEAGYAFSPLPVVSPKPFILVGPPGVGKSSTVAKLAARAVIQKKKPGVITADSIRAGAAEQLAAFTRILNIELKTARTPELLHQMCESARDECDAVFIDTPGINPFRPEDIAYIARLIEASEAEGILVLAAGGDSVESAEIAEAFAGIGVTRILPTRLDMTRRLGALLNAADAGRLMFCDVGSSPRIADGLSAISPIMLARLLLSGRTESDALSKDQSDTDGSAS